MAPSAVGGAIDPPEKRNRRPGLNRTADFMNRNRYHDTIGVIWRQGQRLAGVLLIRAAAFLRRQISRRGSVGRWGRGVLAVSA